MPGSLTPLMQQYFSLKEKYKDSLLFFRLGDFYEMFFEDAKIASRELEIVLTGRDCGLDERAPMCGIPYHSVDNYLQRLVSKGYKVAICEQISDPAESKGLVDRDVVRVISPGTIIEENMLDENKNNFLLSAFLEDDHIGFAYTDISTGDFFLGELSGENVNSHFFDEIARIQPSEIIASDTIFLKQKLSRQLSLNCYLQSYDAWAFEENAAKQRLMRHFNVAGLDGFGITKLRYAICAAGALLAYLEETQKKSLSHIQSIKVINKSDYMVLDASTRRNLELTKPLHFEGSKKSTLINMIDKAKTSMGSRMLRAFIEQPLQSKAHIERRQSAIGELITKVMARDQLQDALSAVYDIERLCSRIVYNTISARDCIALRDTLRSLPVILTILSSLDNAELNRIANGLDTMDVIEYLLSNAIEDVPSINIKDGNIIKSGYNVEVDKLRNAAQNGKQWILEMEAKEREATGIKNLRINYNKVFGYYIEVTKSYQNLVPYHYQRRQTLANSERYIIPALKELEETLLSAQDNLLSLELQLFAEVRETLSKHIEALQNNAKLIAELDAYISLAKVAEGNNYVRPDINETGEIIINAGRHPIVEQAGNGQFIVNDTVLNVGDDRLIILTGPNMAGKSTYMRQVALIVLMAHIGSYVPADSASICVTDRIFTRVGAADDLASGQSTFMVEMNEMANILINSTKNSLLILDEIGRGTSTFDGLSIAWAVLEHIASNELGGAKTLFATHYHELTELEGRLEGVKNYRITVKEIGDDIIFLRKVMRGGTDKSFGIQVAQLAGLPPSVIQRAKEILTELEMADINKPKKFTQQSDDYQLSLLAGDKKQEILKELSKVDIDKLTPVEALNILNELHSRAKILERDSKE